ncbi:MAG TPA: hypothetical protein PLL30_15860 [Candidatus Krumholzibacteria bacterium]|nr:hypothetical protein [Candidatus Krumholzibacteria bacterium]HPD73246.1 hypothetical protein [Candidatus Krumholzibacteria bacterium]HRY40208.1 hypothetical protein [Candidatus Krumholzibacteria bacterium]
MATRRLLAATAALQLAITAAALAAPAPSSVTGTVQNGATVTVSGAGFGYKGVAAPLVWYDFENGVDGSEAIAGWYTGASERPARYDDSYPRGRQDTSVFLEWWGSRVSLYDPDYPNGQQTNYLLWEGPANLNIAYLSVWMASDTTHYDNRFDPPTQYAGAENQKYWRFMGAYDGMLAGPYLKPEAQDFVACDHPGSSMGVGDYDVAGGAAPEARTHGLWDSSGSLQDIWTHEQGWHRHEQYHEYRGYDNPNSSARWFVDGQQRYEIHGVFATEVGYNEVRALYGIDEDVAYRAFELGRYKRMCSEYGGGAGASVYREWFDEVYCDTVQARIEIGNAATWNACTRREIQIPSAWSQSSASFRVNQGLFANGATAYLYVVDRNGAVNQNGLAVTFGQGSGGDTVPPQLSIMDWELSGSDQSLPNPYQMTISGTASDNLGVQSVSWSSSLGGGGIASGTTSWSIANIWVNSGLGEVITVRATDAAGNATTRTLALDEAFPGEVRSVSIGS